jgi:hypothetical protein
MGDVSSRGQDRPPSRRDLSSDENPDSKRLMFHDIHTLTTKQSNSKKGGEGLNVPLRKIRNRLFYFT